MYAEIAQHTCLKRTRSTRLCDEVPLGVSWALITEPAFNAGAGHKRPCNNPHSKCLCASSEHTAYTCLQPFGVEKTWQRAAFDLITTFHHGIGDRQIKR